MNTTSILLSPSISLHIPHLPILDLFLIIVVCTQTHTDTRVCVCVKAMHTCSQKYMQPTESTQLCSYIHVPMSSMSDHSSLDNLCGSSSL